MIEMTAPERAKLLLAMHDALDMGDHPDTPRASQRAALAALVALENDDYAPHEILRLADAMEAYLVCDIEETGPYSFDVHNVAALVGGTPSVARTALRLIGAIPTRSLYGDDWTTATADERAYPVRFPATLLADAIRLELAEAEAFAK